jgi:hypothetical protein
MEVVPNIKEHAIKTKVAIFISNKHDTSKPHETFYVLGLQI